MKCTGLLTKGKTKTNETKESNIRLYVALKLGVVFFFVDNAFEDISVLGLLNPTLSLFSIA